MKKYKYRYLIVWFVTLLLISILMRFKRVGGMIGNITTQYLMAVYSPALDYIQKEGQVDNEKNVLSAMKLFSPTYEYISYCSKQNSEKNDENVVSVVKQENIIANVDDNKDENASTGPVIIEYGYSEQTNENVNAASDTSGNLNTGSNTNSITDACGNVYSRSDLNRYNFTRGFYIVPSHTDLPDSILKPAEFLDKDLSISSDNSKPQILIYHSHSQERFADSTDDLSTSIVGVGDYLTQLLEECGYNVIHDRSVYDYVDGKLDRSKAYVLSAAGANKILADNPSIEIVIDLHRDGVDEATHLVTDINGKRMAKVMFFNGISYSNEQGEIDYLENPFRDTNLACSLQAYLLGEAYFPGFLRRNYINAYRYNFHLLEKSFLIEAGAQNNTVEEVMNAMEPLSQILDKLLKGEKAY